MSIHRKLASSTGETGRKHRAEGENAVKTRVDATRRDDSKRSRSMRLDNHPACLRHIRGRVKAKQGRITLASFR